MLKHTLDTDDEILVVDGHYYPNLECDVNFYVITFDYLPPDVEWTPLRTLS